jgi:putative hemolysin
VGSPFTIDCWPASPLLRRLAGALVPMAETALGLRRLARLYAARPPGDFVRAALAVLDIRVEGGAVGALPASGPVVVVANHPTGALDGLALLEIVRARRPDVRVLGNAWLCRIPEMAPYVIAVDVFRSTAAAGVPGLRAARRWLSGGGTLLVFPAGEVAGVHAADGRIVDAPWRTGVLHLVRWTNAATVPAFVEAPPSRLVAAAGRLHPWIRTALLPRALLAACGRSVGIRFGSAIAAERLARLPDEAARLAYLRARTYGLASVTPASGHLAWRVRRRTTEEVAPAEECERLAADVAALPESSRLLASGAYEVYCAGADRLPAVLPEIGRLRELAFRAAGEGTGRARDLDRFDERYEHLFAWHTGRREIVGAYRIGRTDRIVPTAGVGGLYTRELFHYEAGLLHEIGPALELGRSFVRPEYQRESIALALLWKGIGQLVGREPRYRHLFGPVSISAEYSTISRDLLARFLSSHGFLSALAPRVRPRRPPKPEAEATALVRTRAVTDLDGVDALLRELDAGRGLPVLVRQYLRLNARLLGFSVDPAFGNVLDGLMLVDLTMVAPALLTRYLGRDATARFLACHRAPPPPEPVPGALSPTTPALPA